MEVMVKKYWVKPLLGAFSYETGMSLQ